MPWSHPESLVSPEWLSKHLDDPEICVIDATYKMPGVSPTAIEAYYAGHISGARFFDIDAIADKTIALPHMLPDPPTFAESVAKLGVGNHHRIIAYDSTGIIGAARAWWSFRVFGHDNVAILDGGLPAWRHAGLPINNEGPRSGCGDFAARFRPELVWNKDQVYANLAEGNAQILDARSSARFRGEAAEPWPGRRPGRIPGSFNLDHTLLIDPESKRWKSAESVKELFDQAGVDFARPLVTSCGSGITACVLAFAAYLIDGGDAAVYDGSWAEWGLPGHLPIETGPSKFPAVT